jgi:hypothetical protein
MNTLETYTSAMIHHGYNPRSYVLNNVIKYFLLQSPLRRTPFLLQVPISLTLKAQTVDHLLEPEEGNYRSYAQTEHLNKIGLTELACASLHNLCVKNGALFSYYQLDPMDRDSDNGDSDDCDDIFIKIDDYPIEEVYPLFNLLDFMKHIADFEAIVSEHRNRIDSAEEIIDEQEVANIIDKFTEQQQLIKDRLASVHKASFNIRRDISKYSKNLERAKLLQQKSANKSDRIRWDIERLASETEDRLDVLQQELSAKRNESLQLVSHYLDYISRFQSIDFD